jgi:Rhodopirellula transposase DDE domain
MCTRTVIEQIREQWLAGPSDLDERARRLWAAAKAESLGSGGITAVARATGLSRDTIRRGLRELHEPIDAAMAGRERLPGGGRKCLNEEDPGLMAALEALIEPLTDASSAAALRWTCRSTPSLAEELSPQRRQMRTGKKRARKLDGRTVARLLHDAGYSLRWNRRTIASSDLPVRDAQFGYVNAQVMEFIRQRQPVVAVDTGVRVKGGRSWCADLIGWAPGEPFPGDPGDRHQWSSVGIAEETAGLAVATVRGWWTQTDAEKRTLAKRLLIVADCGGRDDRRTRIWKAALLEFSTVSGLELHICHLPRGTSRWTRVERRCVSFSGSGQGQPVAAHIAVVTVIGSPATSTDTARTVVLQVDNRRPGAKAHDAEFDAHRITEGAFSEAWNYLCR